jgi:hypothetical protein
MRVISLFMTGSALVFGLAACDRPSEPKVSSPPSAATAQPGPQAPAETKPVPNASGGSSSASGSSGANHAGTISPKEEPTRKQEQTEMPLPGQANDHSTLARDPEKPSGR